MRARPSISPPLQSRGGGEFVVGRIARDCAPDEGEVTRVIEREEAHDGRQLGAAGWRASAQCSTANEIARTKPFRIDSPKAAISQALVFDRKAHRKDEPEKSSSLA